MGKNYDAVTIEPFDSAQTRLPRSVMKYRMEQVSEFIRVPYRWKAASLPAWIGNSFIGIC